MFGYPITTVVRWVLIAAAGTWCAHGSAADPLLVVFRDKPPYSYVEKGEQKGFLLDRVKRILQRAGIAAEFVDAPPKRIFADLEANQRPVCTFGWYKIPERERYALFSEPLHQDKPHLLLAGQRSEAALKRHSTLQSVMADSALTIAVADGVSYGPELDAIISAFPGKTDRALISPLQVARKLAAGRADFMFIDQEDHDYLVATNQEFRAEVLVPIALKGMPPGLKRYVLCSRQVGGETLKKIDAAIAAEASGRRNP